MKSGSAIPEYTIRRCETLEDYDACLQMQRRVWQFSDLDITPLRSFVIARRGGGFTAGAFDSNNRLIGFAHALAAFDEKLRPYYYSQMLAVEPGLQNSGIGVKLKLAQRDHALKTGVPLLTWTFDPLQSRNAHFNINKLGVVIRRYEENYYGEGASTVFDTGVPSDRIFAEWWVQSPHVESVLAGARPQFEEGPSVIIPYDIDAIRQQSVENHLRWRLNTREDFRNKLGRGSIARGFASDGERSESRYLLGPDEEQFSFAAYQGVKV